MREERGCRCTLASHCKAKITADFLQTYTGLVCRGRKKKKQLSYTL